MCGSPIPGALFMRDRMLPQGAGQIGPDADEVKRAKAREEDAAAERQGFLIGGIFIATFAFIAAVVMLGSRPAQITLTPTAFAVRAAGYNSEVSRNAIDSVRLVTQITGLGAKLNGFQAGSAYAGLFEMRPYGKARLYVNSSRPPYVMLFTREGVIMVNDATPNATRQLFAALDGGRTTAVQP